MDLTQAGQGANNEFHTVLFLQSGRLDFRPSLRSGLCSEDVSRTHFPELVLEPTVSVWLSSKKGRTKTLYTETSWQHREILTSKTKLRIDQKLEKCFLNLVHRSYPLGNCDIYSSLPSVVLLFVIMQPKIFNQLDGCFRWRLRENAPFLSRASSHIRPSPYAYRPSILLAER